MKQEFINVALTQVGYKEKYSNYTKYGEWYGINPGAWCDMFVCWCANEVGALKKYIPKYANVGDTRKWYKNKGLLSETNPEAGDLFIQMKKGAGQHIGIVEYIDGKYFHTIEGNYSDKVARVKRKIGYKNGDGYLFCKVEWKESSYSGEYPKLPSRGYFKKGDKGEEVKKLQLFLNWALDIKLAIDGSYGPITFDSVKRFEKLVNASKKNGLFGKVDLAKAMEYKK